VIFSTHKHTGAERDAAASCHGCANWRCCQALRIAVTTLIPSWVHFCHCSTFWPGLSLIIVDVIISELENQIGVTDFDSLVGNNTIFID
jgi:hypothetical protein